MARWTQDRIKQRIDDLQERLAQGQTLEEIGHSWGTSKQNVSQLRKKYLGSRELPVPEAQAPREGAQDSEEQLAPDDRSLFLKAYQMILARDRLISDLEEQLRALKYQLYEPHGMELTPDNAKQSLKKYISGHG